MNIYTANDTYYACPETVACPAAGCRAPVGQPCAARKTHSARISLAINRNMRDEFRQHQRAEKARQRVTAALTDGRSPDDADITTMLACVCEDCRLTPELLRLFTAATAAVEAVS